jgi:hypothetical protein
MERQLAGEKQQQSALQHKLDVLEARSVHIHHHMAKVCRIFSVFVPCNKILSESFLGGVLVYGCCIELTIDLSISKGSRMNMWA